MQPFVLRTERLVLEAPTASDAALIAEYCGDPLFERFLETPWPYALSDAEWFISELVAGGWRSGRELTWALREQTGGAVLGIIGLRIHETPGEADAGYWLGAPHRGRGLMTEALRAVDDWAFSNGIERMLWRCVAGNLASASVARKAGYRFMQAETGRHLGRDGQPEENWHAELLATDSRSPKPGWP